jgi:hypothetical protein
VREADLSAHHDLDRSRAGLEPERRPVQRQAPNGRAMRGKRMRSA